MDTDNTDAFVEKIAEAVVRKIDEHEKINLLADAVLARLQFLDEGARKEWNVPDKVPTMPGLRSSMSREVVSDSVSSNRPGESGVTVKGNEA